MSIDEWMKRAVDYFKSGKATDEHWEVMASCLLHGSESEGLDAWLDEIIESYEPTEQPVEWSDKHDRWQTAIEMAHPLVTGKHKTYAKAHEMVSNRHSKGALVDLVNWLLAYRRPTEAGDIERESVALALIKYVNDRLKQHTDNYRLWENGFLAPTEPDEEERNCTMRELQACIIELRGLLAQPFMCNKPATNQSKGES